MATQAQRSLKLSREGKQKADTALLKLFSKSDLAAELQISRTTIHNFFAGKPVKRELFHQICKKLKLQLEEVIDIDDDIDALVREVREKIKPFIQKRCGTMRVLDMTQPIELGDIYTSVNVLEKITRIRRKTIDELLQECSSNDFERFGLSRITEKRVPGLDAIHRYPKLIVLGKPGAGKTTFLKYLAMHCNSGEFQDHFVPIFITLKDFAEAENKPKFLEYISQQLCDYGITDTQITKLFKHHRLLVLLDGLDEVREDDNSRVFKEIRELSDKFSENQFVLTCRIAAKEYTFEQFTEVEVADFDDRQIADFSNKWFQLKDPVKADKFINKLKDNKPIKELATNPLLLTLLCLVFEESGKFPSNRSELYKDGVDVLLKKWDVKRNIEREQVYKKLSLQRKEDLLSQVALTTFEEGNYFFKQKEIEQHITDYISNFPDASNDPEALQLDSEAVLKSIEAQHGLLVERARGIYSFSHLTLHEYFAAREIVFSPDLEQALKNLVNRITEKRWREVFLLTSGMLKKADRLLQLMKQQVDALVAGDEKLQEFLVWVNQKTISVNAPYKTAAVRAFYLNLDHDLYGDHGINLSFALDPNFDRDFDLKLDHDLQHVVKRTLDRNFDRNFDRELFLSLDLSHHLDFALDLSLDLAPQIVHSLDELRYQLPNSEYDLAVYEKWWKVKGQAWTVKLRNVMVKYRNIGHDWQFSEQQKQLLKQYYDANKLLVECLNSDCYVSRNVRQEIEDTLLLPMAEIENYKASKSTD